MIPPLEMLSSTQWRDYQLIDSGNGEKLERFGEFIFNRPEHQAMWAPGLTKKEWSRAHAKFIPSGGEETGGNWQLLRALEPKWQMNYRSFSFEARFSQSRHLGVFPEQAVHWDWINAITKRSTGEKRILNLFGYTGLATLSAAQAGAYVTHVDASKKSVTWARHNQVLSGLAENPVRWIVDDAMKFVLRENRREAKYDGIIMDPPKFGRGPKGEVWSSLEMMPVLMKACRDLLVPDPMFIVLTVYAIRASALSLYYLMEEMMDGLKGHISCGELVSIDSSGHRVISSAIFVRWASRELINNVSSG